jgi:hypothetical protein
MSRPGGPYGDEQYPPRRHAQQQGHPQGDHQRGYGGQGYGNQGYGGYPDRGHADQGYRDPGYADRGYADGYGGHQPPARHQPAPRGPAAERPAPPPGRDGGGGFRLPGLGLLLSLLGLVVQLVSFTVLPWVHASASKDSQALPAIWDLAKDFDARGFSGAYVLLFSYPLAVLGILLSLVAVIESVAVKVVWAALTLIGIAVLVLRFGLGPLGETVTTDAPLDFSRQEITIAIVALAALVVVIFMLKMAMSTFRRLAGLVLLVIAGVHVAAVSDLTDGFGFADLQVGAYGPALGYVLAAAAAFVGPRRLA